MKDIYFKCTKLGGGILSIKACDFRRKHASIATAPVELKNSNCKNCKEWKKQQQNIVEIDLAAIESSLQNEVKPKTSATTYREHRKNQPLPKRDPLTLDYKVS
jgi:hypothetical protein